MTSSRLRRFEDKKASKRLVMAVVGLVALIILLLLFGLKLLIGFSILVDKIRGGNPQQVSPKDILLPPILDSLEESTNSATIFIHGKSDPKKTVIVFLNDREYKQVTTTDAGDFTLDKISVNEQEVTISAKLIGDKEELSALSNIISTLVDRTPPTLEVTKPSNNQTINDGTHKTLVEGKTDEASRVTINGRIVVLRNDGSFTYPMSLVDGENNLMIVSSDSAGNQTKIERRVTYQP